MANLYLEANPQEPFDFSTVHTIGWRVNLIRDRAAGRWNDYTWERLRAIRQAGCPAILLVGAETCSIGYEDAMSDAEWDRYKAIFLSEFEQALVEFAGYYDLAEMFNEPNSGVPSPPWWSIRPQRLHDLQEGAHKITRKIGVPLISAAMLTIADNDGTEYWSQAFPDGDSHADLIGAHIYLKTDQLEERLRFLLDWTGKHFKGKPLAITEIGSRTGVDIPIEAETKALLDRFGTDRLALISKFCLEDFNGVPFHYGIRNKPAWNRFWQIASEINNGGTQPPEGDTLATPTLVHPLTIDPKRNDLIIVITGQDGNKCVDPLYGNTEQSAAAWMVKNKLTPLAAKVAYNFHYIQTPLEVKEKTPYQTGIPATLQACFAYAKAYPSRHFDIVSWHTDASLDQDDPADGHFGLMAGDEKGRALGRIWAKYFGAVYGDTARYLEARLYPEYYALGYTLEIPANVTLLLAETGVHDDAIKWRHYLDNVDAIAKAAIDAESEALAVVVPEPAPITDYKVLYEAEIAKNQVLQSKLATIKDSASKILAELG